MRPPVTLVLVLHGHIPDVLGHGTWPHGANWLYEAAAETYQPFLIAVERLLAAGIPVKATVGMTPVLSEQLADERFTRGFDDYLAQRARAAREDEARLSAAATPRPRPSPGSGRPSTKVCARISPGARAASPRPFAASPSAARSR